MNLKELKIDVDPNTKDEFRVICGRSWGEFASGVAGAHSYKIPPGHPTYLFGLRFMRYG